VAARAYTASTLTRTRRVGTMEKEKENTHDRTHDANDGRLVFPAAGRNMTAISEALAHILLPLTKQTGGRQAGGVVLEVASGSGEHVCHFQQTFPDLTFQGSDIDAVHRQSIDAWRTHLGLAATMPAALDLDATHRTWPHVDGVVAMLCINMIHISPWEATTGLLVHAGRILDESAPLIFYGPFIRDGVETAPSNVRFDASLRARNAAWGVRALSDVEAEASLHGLQLDSVVAMPANNCIVVFRKT